jgi:hypothetical protein
MDVTRLPAPDPVQPPPDALQSMLRATTLHSRMGVWVWAVFAVFVVPLFPVFVEAVKKGMVAPETFLLTAAVLAAGYGFSSEMPLFWAIYGIIFLASIGYDFKPDAALPDFLKGFGVWIFHNPQLSILLLTGLLHAIERFRLHVVLDRPFPDWRQGA